MSPKWIVLLTLAFSLSSGPRLCAFARQQPETQEPAQAPQEGPRRGPVRGDGVFGRIQSVSGRELTIARPDGEIVKVRVTPQTVFSIDRNPAKLEDFKVGTGVMVRGSKGADNVWTAEFLAARSGSPQMLQGQLGKDFVVGEVKSIDGAAVTLLRPDGVTQTLEADENTSLRKHRESVTLADIHPGDTVIARGELKDGSFVPKTLNVLTPEDVQRMRQFMGTDGPAAGASKPGPAAEEKKPSSETKPPQDFR